MKIYTRGGDAGQTALFGGQRVSKAHARVRAYGAIDEANSALGFARAAITDPKWGERLEDLMSDMFDVGAELATPVEGEDKLSTRLDSRIDGARIETLEQWIDEGESELTPLTSFVLPTGCDAAARFQMARSVFRRAEREVVEFAEAGSPVRAETLGFLNRMSDLLFVWGRLANAREAVGDVLWRAKKDSGSAA